MLNEETDLAVALIGASYLDQCLRSLLENKFIVSGITKELLVISLNEFAIRAKLAYALGLINKTVYQDLSQITVIRNHFAHSHFTISFNDKVIIDLCKSLKTNRIIDDIEIDGQVSTQSARSQYCITVALISQRILLTAHGMKHKKELDSSN